MSSPILLSSVLTAGTPYEWHDAVALVAQLIDQARTDSQARKAQQIPDPSGIAIEAGGTLSLALRDGHTLPMMPGAVQLLQQLLSGREQPTPLWLYVMQTASASPMPSLDELAVELNRWERPNRQARLAAFYSRAQAQGGQAGATPAPAVGGQITEAPRAAAKKSRSGPKREGGRRAPLVAALVAGAAACAAAWFIMGQPAIWTPRRSSAAPSLAGVPDYKPMVAPGAPADSGAPPPTAGRSGGSRRAAPRRGRGGTESGSAVAVASEELERARLLFDQQQYAAATARFAQVIELLGQDDTPEARELRQLATDLAELSRAAIAESAAAAAREYRTGDPGVVEPVPLSLLPAPPRAGVSPTEMEVLELHIDQDGNVTSARFVMGQPSFRNRWMVSAAKTWRFQPATRDGQPVRFVKRIVLDDGSQPR